MFLSNPFKGKIQGETIRRYKNSLILSCNQQVSQVRQQFHCYQKLISLKFQEILKMIDGLIFFPILSDFLSEATEDRLERTF